MDSGSSCGVINEHCFLKLNPSIQASKVDLQVLLVGFLGEKSWAIGEVLLEITIGNAPLTRSETLNFIITHADMTGIPRTITVNRKPFNTKHKLNEYSHIKPIKKRRSLGPDRSTSAHKEVEELTREGILWEAIRQT
ncbi:hypothetical protein Tco_0868956 [Tanacetum coccineum]